MRLRTCLPPLLLAAFVLAASASRVTAADDATPPHSSPAVADDIQRETKEAWQALEKKIAVLNQDLTGLKSNAAQASADAKSKTKELLAETQKKLDATQRELTAVKNAHTNQWQAVKTGVDKGVQEIQQSLEKLRDALK